MEWDGRCHMCGLPVAVGDEWWAGMHEVQEDVELASGVHGTCLDYIAPLDGCGLCQLTREGYVMGGRYLGDPRMAASLMGSGGLPN